MSVREVWILSAVRTPVGRFRGALQSMALRDLAAVIVTEALRRSRVPADQIGEVVLGNVIATEPADTFLARFAALSAGIPAECPAYGVNRLCGSGLQAIVSGAQSILLGDCDFVIAGGAESMSRGAAQLGQRHWSHLASDAGSINFVTGVMHDPMLQAHVGVTAENIAQRYGISRQRQDELSLRSQQRAARAIAEARFASQMVPVQLADGALTLERDEHPRPGVTLGTLARLQPKFRAGGTVTAGNAAGFNDGASALVLADAAAAKRLGLAPVARLVSYAHAGVDPAYMGLGPVPAARSALKRAGLGLQSLDVIEANEASAAQTCAVIEQLELDPDKVNPNGSGISLGHPVGATGAIISTKAIHELIRTGGRYGLATTCIGGGQGIAAIFERA